MSWYLAVLRKYAEFSGRARRTEFWMFVLFNFLIGVAISVVEAVIGSPGVLGAIYSLAVLLPALGVSVRRLHDIGRSGWWILVGLVPLVGVIVLVVFALKEGQHGPNAYGPDPKAGQSTQAV